MTSKWSLAFDLKFPSQLLEGLETSAKHVFVNAKSGKINYHVNGLKMISRWPLASDLKFPSHFWEGLERSAKHIFDRTLCVGTSIITSLASRWPQASSLNNPHMILVSTVKYCQRHPLIPGVVRYNLKYLIQLWPLIIRRWDPLVLNILQVRISTKITGWPLGTLQRSYQ